MSSPCLWAKERITIGNYVNIGGDCIIMDSDAHNLDWRVRDSGEMFSAVESMDGQRLLRLKSQIKSLCIWKK